MLIWGKGRDNLLLFYLLNLNFELFDIVLNVFSMFLIIVRMFFVGKIFWLLLKNIVLVVVLK